MNPVKITDRFSVAGQPDLADFPAIAGAGFAKIINNRPDGEEPGQPGDTAEAGAAAQAGLAYAHVPVTGATITLEAVKAFQDEVDAADGPVLAHCKAGTRSLYLYVLGQVLSGRMTPEEVVPFGAQHGFDLRGALVWLARHT